MLTELACKNASCPSDKKRARLSDSGNLYLEVASNESKRWFWKYTVGGKEKRLAIGSYPAVKLKDARAARDDARKVLQTGADPTQRRRLDKAKVRATAVTTYEKVAREFHALKQREWSEAHSTKWLRLQESNLFPWIGGLPLGEITANVLLEPLRRVEGKGLNETAVSLRQYAGQVFRYGIATGRCEDDPATKLRGALGAVIVKNMAAVLDPQKAGDLMRAIDGYRGLPATREALLLSALLFQRPGNIRAMEWSWVDFSGSQVVIPAASMKRTKQAKLNGEPHLVPLAPQAVDSLKRMKVLTGHGRYVFPSLLTGERPMSDNTVNTALRRMGFNNTEMTAHGFRAMARTIMVDQLRVNPEVIEEQLAHGKSGPLGTAYNRTQLKEQRREMMVLWANYLDQLRLSKPVLS